MKPKTMILMVVAVSCGLGASYMTSRLLADRNQDVEKVAILVAKKNLDLGATLKAPDEIFEEKQIPKGEEPRQAIVDIESLKGRVLKRSLRAGDFVTTDDLDDGKSGFIHYNMPQGHVAVGLRVNPEGIAGGFASLPGSRVNILWTVRRSSDIESFSKILLENVLVLAADTQTIKSENGQAMPANVVTVALKHEDSIKLELAKSIGTVSLVLRRFQDVSHANHGKINVQTLIRGGPEAGIEEPVESSIAPPQPAPVTSIAPPKEVAPPQPPPVVVDKGPGGRNHTLVVIDGDKTQTTSFVLDDKNHTVNPNARRSPAPPTPQIVPAPKTDETPGN